MRDGWDWQWTRWARHVLAFTLCTVATLVAFKVIFGDPLPYGTLLVAPLIGLWLGTVSYRSTRAAPAPVGHGGSGPS